MASTSSGERASSGDLPEAVLEDLLSVDRRREALAALLERHGPLCVEDLAVVARAREAGGDPDAVDPAERRRLGAAFFQEHLPKLTATGVVAYDSQLGTVELADPSAVAAAIEAY